MEEVNYPLLREIAKHFESEIQVRALSVFLLGDSDIVTGKPLGVIPDLEKLAHEVLQTWVRKKPCEATGMQLREVLNNEHVGPSIAEEFAEQLVPTQSKSFTAS